MKKIIFILFLLHSSLVVVNSQWQPDMRLTYDTSNSFTLYNNSRCVASSGDTIHVVWYDNRDGNYEIYYKRSTNGGISWKPDTCLSNNSTFSGTPTITVSASVVYVVWDDSQNGGGLFFKRSTNAGITWESNTQLSTSVYSGLSIASWSSSVYVVWANSMNQLRCKKSTNWGSNWGTDVLLTNNLLRPMVASVAASGIFVHIVWEDDRDGNREIYYKRSSDGGNSWGPDTRLTFDPEQSFWTTVAVSGSTVHVVWQDNRNESILNIFYKRSTNDGLNWSADTQISNSNSDAWLPSITASGQAVHVVWYDFRDTNTEIYYKFSSNGGLGWEADTRLTNDTSESTFPSVAASGLAVQVVWTDLRDGNSEIYYKRNPTGNFVGINPSNTEVLPKEYNLSQNYPNPFNPTTKIRFALHPSPQGEGLGVRVIVYDILGREIAVLVNEYIQPGTYEITWDAANFSSGVYYYKLIAGEYRQTKKMVLIK